jgi:methylmalonyl-CoA mutase
MMESLTNALCEKARAIITEVESMGGMATAVASGMPKLRIEESAAKRQARIDSGQETIVGVNKYQLQNEPPIDVLAIDNTNVRHAQIERLKRVKSTRDPRAVEKCLMDLEEGAKGGGNLLTLGVSAARARCTVGEISDALERVWGRHSPITRVISGAYKSAYGEADEIETTLKMAEVKHVFSLKV